jgi:hypothetical protein
MTALRGQFEAEEEELKVILAQEQAADVRVRQSGEAMARSRKADEPTAAANNRARRVLPQGGRK